MDKDNEKKVGLTLNVTPNQRTMIKALCKREHRGYGTLFVWLAEKYIEKLEREKAEFENRK